MSLLFREADFPVALYNGKKLNTFLNIHFAKKFHRIGFNDYRNK